MCKKEKTLQDKLDNLAFNNKTANHNLVIDLDNKDNAPSQWQSSWQSIFVAMNCFTSTFKSQTTFSMAGTIIEVRKNKKFPNISLFYGNVDDREKWEEWWLHLESKFYQSTILYICELDKINYIRDHCKDIVFDVIKPKANLISANVYFTSSEIIQDLKNMFDKFDKVAKLDVFLYDL